MSSQPERAFDAIYNVIPLNTLSIGGLQPTSKKISWNPASFVSLNPEKLTVFSNARLKLTRGAGFSSTLTLWLAEADIETATRQAVRRYTESFVGWINIPG